MKLVLLIFASVAVLTNAASISNYDDNQAVGETQPKQHEEITTQDSRSSSSEEEDSEGEAQTKPKQGLDVLPYPLSVFIRLIGKEALKTFDILTICDTVQLIDWNTYKNLLIKEDYEGFKQKFTTDEIMSSLGETIEEFFQKYTKELTDGDPTGLKSGFEKFMKNLTLKKESAKPCGIEKKIKEWIQNVISGKPMPKEALENMQKNIKIMLDSLQRYKVANSVHVSQKNNIEMEDNGKGANY